MASEKDLIRRGDVLELLYRLKEDKECPKNYGTLLTIISEVWDMQVVEPMKWIPVKLRRTTEEDGVNMAECPFMLDCPLPDEECEILTCTINGFVTVDEFCRDGVECYLDSGHDWDEIAAWMPLPEPYKDGEE